MINTAIPEREVDEGISAAQVNGSYLHRCGGHDDNESSAVFRYVSICRGGVRLLPNKENSDLSLVGVGRGTAIGCGGFGSRRGEAGGGGWKSGRLVKNRQGGRLRANE